MFLFIVYLRAVGGEIGATSSLAPKIGPLGLVSSNMFHHFDVPYANTPHVAYLVAQEGW